MTHKVTVRVVLEVVAEVPDSEAATYDVARDNVLDVIEQHDFTDLLSAEYPEVQIKAVRTDSEVLSGPHGGRRYSLPE